jgi:hypothetical protein
MPPDPLDPLATRSTRSLGGGQPGESRLAPFFFRSLQSFWFPGAKTHVLPSRQVVLAAETKHSARARHVVRSTVCAERAIAHRRAFRLLYPPPSLQWTILPT